MADPRAVLEQALALHGQGRLDEAEAKYREVLDLAPEEANSLHMLGVIALARGEPERAAALIERSLARKRKPEALYNHGVALQALDRLDEAIASWREALALKPDYEDALYNLAKALKEQGQEDEAVALYRHILGQRPRDPEAQAMLADLLSARGDQQGAAEAYGAVVADRPDDARAWYNLGIARDSLDQPEAAREAYETALRCEPQHAQAMLNLSSILYNRGALDEAEPLVRRAAQLRPDLPEAHKNLGDLLRDRGELGAALERYDAALALRPGYTDAAINRAMALLLAGRFGEGFEAFEARWDGDQLVKPRFPAPEWRGGPIAGKTLFLANEQGIGDMLMFAGLVDDLRQTGARLLLGAQPRLVELFRRSFPDVTVYPMKLDPPAELAGQSVDLFSPLGSTARWLRRTEADFPRHQGYLVPDPARVAAATAWLAGLPPGRRVGIAWRSGGLTDGTRRVTSLGEDWAPLLERADHALVCLQWGEVDAELAALERDRGVRVHRAPDLDLQDDLDGVAALVAALDLVITPANTVAHFAGALGRPVWALVPYQPSWRWLLARDDSPWYPSMRLFRQSAADLAAGGWRPVLERVAAAFGDLPDP